MNKALLSIQKLNNNKISQKDFISLLNSTKSAVALFQLDHEIVASFTPKYITSIILSNKNKLLTCNQIFLDTFLNKEKSSNFTIKSLVKTHPSLLPLFFKFAQNKCYLPGSVLSLKINGKIRQFSISMHPCFEDSLIHKIWLVFFDISKRFEATEYVSELEHHYRNIINNSNIIFLRLNHKDHIVYISNNSERILGVPYQNLLSLKTLNKLFAKNDYLKLKNMLSKKHGSDVFTMIVNKEKIRVNITLEKFIDKFHQTLFNDLAIAKIE